MTGIIFHIGFHKTATSWLQGEYFPNIESAGLVPGKDPPWCSEFLRYLIKTRLLDYDSSEARALLMNEKGSNNNVIVSAERITGHPMSGVECSGQIATKIYKSFPEAKIIIVLRNQIDLLDSLYRQLIREGVVVTPQSLLQSDWWKQSSFDLQNYKFSSLVNHYYNLFGQKRVKVLFFEQFVENKNVFVSELNEFVGWGCSFDSGQQNKVRNPRLNYYAVKAIRILNLLRRTEFNPEFCYIRFARTERLVELIGYALRRLNDRPIFNSKEVDFLRKYYALDNKKLEEVLGDKLPAKWE